MSDSDKHGYYLVSRKLRGHPYAREKRTYSRYEALLWLIEHAAFADHTVSSQGHTVSVPRGHILASVRRLADQFRWSHGRVQRFVGELLTDGTMVAANCTPLGTLYSLVNYEFYQGFGTADGTPNDTPTERQRDGNGTIINKGNKGKPSTRVKKSDLTDEQLDAEYDVLRAAYVPPPKPKWHAGKLAHRVLRRRGAVHETLLQATFGYAQECRRDIAKRGPEAAQFIMQPATFYGPKDRYLDYVDTADEHPAMSATQPGGADVDFWRQQGYPVPVPPQEVR